MGSSRFLGFSFIQEGSAASPAKARPPRVSITIFIQSICTTVIGESNPRKGLIIDIPTAEKFIVSWRVINLRMLLKIFLP